MQRRKTLKKLPLQANFYPVPALIFLQDEKSRLSLMTQQANGAASLETGMKNLCINFLAILQLTGSLKSY